MGKVRDTHTIPGHPDKRFIVSTDAVSVLDFPLGQPVGGKGAVLNAFSHFWFTMLAGYGINHHMIAAGAAIDEFLPDRLKHNRFLQTNGMVVETLNMSDGEFVVREKISGGGWKSHREKGHVCGHILPNDIQEGDHLPYLLDTTTTKSQDGHDDDIDYREARRRFPEEILSALQVHQIISAYTKRRGVLTADGKSEWGRNRAGRLVLGDEVGTPDANRFWPLKQWLDIQKKSAGRTSPASFDKELARIRGRELGIGDLDPKNPSDRERVLAMELPSDFIRTLQQVYRYIFWRITGETQESYWSKLGVIMPKKHLGKVVLILGSESDRKILTDDIINGHRQRYGEYFDLIELSTASCHRNLRELRDFVLTRCRDAQVIISAGGMALAKPGIIDAELAAEGLKIPVIGLALGEPGSKELQVAADSIYYVPGQPVIFDELADLVYQNQRGFEEILFRLAHGELPPPPVRINKPPNFAIQI